MARIDNIIKEAANPNFLKDLIAQPFMPKGSRQSNDGAMLSDTVFLGSAIDGSDWNTFKSEIDKYARSKGVPVIVTRVGPSAIDVQWGGR